MKLFTHTALALSMAIGIALSAGSAEASKQAVVKITWSSLNALFFPPSGLVRAAGTGTVNETVIVATVNTTAGTPTPSVMWASGIATESFVGTASYPYTPFSSRSSMNYIGAATLVKSNTLAAPSGGSTVPPIPATTTKCFASVAGLTPGPPSLPGSCFPRPGTMLRSPGAKKYGGVARILGGGTIFQFTRFGYPTGLDIGSFRFVNEQSPAFAAASIGNYGATATGVQYNSVLQTTRSSFATHQSAPFTTGMATAKGGNYYTSTSFSGGNSLNVTNLTGMISLVKPQMGRSFSRRGGVFGGHFFTFASLNILSITFAGEVPEPGSLAMLAFGMLGLGGLAIRRRR